MMTATMRKKIFLEMGMKKDIWFSSDSERNNNNNKVIGS